MQKRRTWLVTHIVLLRTLVIYCLNYSNTTSREKYATFSWTLYVSIYLSFSSLNYLIFIAFVEVWNDPLRFTSSGWNDRFAGKVFGLLSSFCLFIQQYSCKKVLSIFQHWNNSFFGNRKIFCSINWSQRT